MTSFFVWIVLGWIAGYFIIPLFRRSEENISLDRILGIIGALAGGSLLTWFGTTPTNQYYSVLAAITGAVLLLLINYGIRRSSADWLTQKRKW
jgi:uncharacterized membrane protein YeaQ/YmgE (transglycosylase-associated protein family)